ncbi:SEC-C metal-binding domain-containing protein [Teredinibacter purpureus]|uniref:SEC-C metal-binding domain-containing protein n=1 Tax=Teredinibacter purpureus TaxID=2731756 RepID=UPI0009E23C54|nr:SEC-C metal-binding domain-containing protein [Teredinibacter purpureus]
MTVFDGNNLINKSEETNNEHCCSNISCCAPQSPTIRLTPKVGRNKPCPCDSGRKFKKCCGHRNKGA